MNQRPEIEGEGAVFVSLSVPEVYNEGYDVGETDVALLMHMVPTVVVLLALGVGRGAAPHPT